MAAASPPDGHLLGLALAAGAASLWGLGGVAAQDLFQHHAIDPASLVALRMTVGGLVLLTALRPAPPRGHWKRLLFFALVGMTLTQYAWFAAIDHSNVATATFVQYSGVAMTAGWQVLRHQVPPSRARLAAIAASGIGVVLLVLGQGGGLHALRVSPRGLSFALISAAAFAFYLLNSPGLVRATSLQTVAGWGLLSGGLPMFLSAPPWTGQPSGDPLAVALTAFVVIASTSVAFSVSLAALRRISPTEFAVTSTLEPAIAAFAGVLLLGVRLSPLQYLGGASTLAAVLILANAENPRKPAVGRRTL
jgi:drug/metabolite transporter (DMT)-like permease